MNAAKTLSGRGKHTARQLPARLKGLPVLHGVVNFKEQFPNVFTLVGKCCLLSMTCYKTSAGFSRHRD